jgi:hypothetical protein
MRVKRVNPFASTPGNNPFQATDAVKLVDVPPMPETHERRQPRRGYLVAGQGGGGMDLDGLFAGMRGGKRGRPVPHEKAPEPEEDENEEKEEKAEPGSRNGPPRYGPR